MRADDSRRWVTAGLVAAGVSLALSGPVAMAQTPFASATLYELREDVACHPGGGSLPDCSDSTAKGFGTRIADATLVGGVSPTPGGISGGIAGEIAIDAASMLSKVDWTGPVHGKFTATDAATNTTVTGTLAGQLDLSAAILGQPQWPLAPVSGRWRGTRGTLRNGGEFAGVFLIPFQLAGLPGWFYLELDATGQPTGGVTALAADEFIAGDVPLVKLLVTLYTQ